MKTVKAVIADKTIQVVILDISGIYAQIYDQGFFLKDDVNNITTQYSDISHWKVVVLN